MALTGLSTISVSTIIQWLVPLSSYCKTPNVTVLLTDEEQKINIKESSDDQVHPINYIHNHPEFWTEDRIKQEHWRFTNVATTFDKTHITDEQGRPLYLNVLDIDSKQAFDTASTSDSPGKFYLLTELLKKLIWGQNGL